MCLLHAQIHDKYCEVSLIVGAFTDYFRNSGMELCVLSVEEEQNEIHFCRS